MKNEPSTVMKPTKPFVYAVGMFGTSIPVNMFKAYAAIFYIDKLGLITTPQWSLVLAIYTFVDAIDNPVYGFLSDSTRTKWGRRRPWLVIGAPLLALSFIMFYNVPSSIGPGSAFWYVLLMYILTGTLDSLINSNYGALFPELFRTEAQRAKTNALRQAFQLLAMVISIALTPIITEKIGYSATAIAYSVLAVSVILFMAFGCNEDPEAQYKPKPNLFKTVWQIVKTPKFWLYGLTNAAFFAALGLVLQAVPFFVKYTLNEGGLGSTILQGTVIVLAIASIAVWVRVVKKTSVMPAWRISLICVAAGFIPLYFAKSLLTATLAIVIFGIGYGGSSVTMDLVGAKILDEDSARYGIRREGTYSSLMSVLNKTGGLFTSLAFFLVYKLYGFESGENPGANPAGASRFLLVVFPLAVMLLCVALSFTLRFKNKPAAPEAGEPEGGETL